MAMLLPLKLSAETVPEYDLKAAYIYNFALFTEWPADRRFEGGTLNICINSSSALRAPLAALNDRAIKGRRVAVRPMATLEQLGGCHVLFVDTGDRAHWPRIRQDLAGASMLTIADDEEIAHDGAVIALALDGKRVVFDIDTRAARRARLELSSKLLRLARSVQ